MLLKKVTFVKKKRNDRGGNLRKYQLILFVVYPRFVYSSFIAC
jgi:hypothetical protein